MNRAERRAAARIARGQPAPMPHDTMDFLAACRKHDPLRGDEISTSRLRAVEALHLLATGTATTDHVDVLVGVMNACLVLLERHEWDDQSETIHAARDAIVAVCDRYHRTRRWGVSGDDRAALERLLDVLEAALEIIPLAQWRACTRIADARCRRGVVIDVSQAPEVRA